MNHREQQISAAVTDKLDAMSKEELLHLLSDHILRTYDYITTLYITSDKTPEEIAAKIIEALA